MDLTITILSKNIDYKKEKKNSNLAFILIKNLPNLQNRYFIFLAPILREESNFQKKIMKLESIDSQILSKKNDEFKISIDTKLPILKEAFRKP